MHQLPFTVFYYFMAYQIIFWPPFHDGKGIAGQHNVFWVFLCFFFFLKKEKEK